MAQQSSALCTASWGSWCLVACLFGATAPSLPCLCPCCQTRQDTPFLCYLYVCHARSRNPCQQPANCPSCQLHPACSSHCLQPAPPVAFACLAARRVVGGSVPCVFTSPAGSPLPHPRGCRKLHTKLSSSSGGVLCPLVPLPGGFSLGALQGTVLESIQGEGFCVSTQYRAFTM